MQQNASDSSGSSSPVYLDVAARLAEVFLRLESDVLQRSFPQLRLRDLGAPTFWTLKVKAPTLSNAQNGSAHTCGRIKRELPYL